MSLSLSIAVYVICWWVVLFAVLPWRIGAQPDENTRDVHAEASGAPLAPHLGLKFLLTTVISAVVFAGVYAIIAFRLINLDALPF